MHPLSIREQFFEKPDDLKIFFKNIWWNEKKVVLLHPLSIRERFFEKLNEFKKKKKNFFKNIW